MLQAARGAAKAALQLDCSGRTCAGRILRRSAPMGFHITYVHLLRTAAVLLDGRDRHARSLGKQKILGTNVCPSTIKTI